MAITNHERVGKAMELLKSGLGPFVEREFKSMFTRTAAAAEASTLPGRGPPERQEADRRIGTRRRCSSSCGNPGTTCSA